MGYMGTIGDDRLAVLGCSSLGGDARRDSDGGYAWRSTLLRHVGAAAS